MSIRGGDISKSDKQSALKKQLSINGGAITTTKQSTVIDHSKRRTTTLNALHQTSFLIVLSTSIVAFAPLPSITRHLASKSTADALSPQSQAIQLLSILSSISACIELFASPLVGVWIDSRGRKLPSLILYGLIVVANAGVVLHPSVLTISLSKIVNGVVGGFLVIVANAIIADMFAVAASKEKGVHSNDQMGTVMGRQAAAVSLGFLSGSLIGGRLTEGGERMTYGYSLLFSVLEVMNGALRMMDSVDLSTKNVHSTHSHSWDHATLRQKVLEAPLSSIQLLFSYGSHMRTLALLLMLQSAPMFMGDVFQLFAKDYWHVTPKTFGSIIGESR